jgi:hypothetical protein
MKASTLWFSGAILAIASVVFTTPAPAHADTYKRFDLGNFANQRFPIGITASSTVVFVDMGGIGGPCSSNSFDDCFETWVDGTRITFSPTDPGFTYDNGTGCTPFTIPSVSTGSTRGVCNNGHEVYAYKRGVGPMQGFYDGPYLNNVADRAGGGEVFQVDLNASGDFVLVEGLNPSMDDASGEWYEYIDLSTDTVPEPASIFLLGTGALAALGSMRRRLSQ